MIEFGDFHYDAESRFLYRGQEEILLPPAVSAAMAACQGAWFTSVRAEPCVP